jgi:hypothetical protein
MWSLLSKIINLFPAYISQSFSCMLNLRISFEQEFCRILGRNIAIWTANRSLGLIDELNDYTHDVSNSFANPMHCLREHIDGRGCEMFWDVTSIYSSTTSKSWQDASYTRVCTVCYCAESAYLFFAPSKPVQRSLLYKIFGAILPIECISNNFKLCIPIADNEEHSVMRH